MISFLVGIIEEKVEYLCSGGNQLIQTLFSPHDDGKTLASITFSDIKIWRIDNYYNIYNIKIDITPKILFNFQFEWSESGEYFIFPKNKNKIEVFSLETKSIQYYIESMENIFFLLE